MSKVSSIIHVYQHKNDLYVVPLARISRGPWLETLPVNKIALAKADDSLADLLADAQRTAGRVLDEAPNAWHTSFGENLRQADALCAVIWYKEGIIKVIPKRYQAPSGPDDEDYGWYDIAESTTELPDDVSLKTLAENIQYCLKESKKLSS